RRADRRRVDQSSARRDVPARVYELRGVGRRLRYLNPAAEARRRDGPLGVPGARDCGADRRLAPLRVLFHTPSRQPSAATSLSTSSACPSTLTLSQRL